MSEDEGEYLTPIMRRELRRVVSSIIGESGLTVLSFQLGRRIGMDPLEALTEHPHEFYRGLREIYEDGADTMILLLGKILIKRYCLDLDSRKLLLLMKNDDPSSRESLRRIWMEIAKISLRSRGELNEVGEE